ncbi:hypothetical protein Tco_0464687 [Tanacetum coccineum]
MIACLNDLSYITLNNKQNEPTQGDIGETSNEPTQAKHNEFEELYASANEELYPSCESVTRLDVMAKFTHFKVKGEDNKDKQLCPVCNTSRWKDNNTTGKKVPKKCTEPGKMQHLVDGKAWKNFDTQYSDFKVELRYVRLGFAADGFYPFSNLSQSYSMWPVILTTYNLPPWLVPSCCLEHVVMNPTLLEWGCNIDIQRISLTGFLAQRVGSSNTDALDSACLLVLNTGTSQNRQHESRKSPTAELFDVDSRRISIHHCEYSRASL